jgi:hydroxymethylpyrimidine/phosphomethylpyrimidine kinase
MKLVENIAVLTIAGSDCSGAAGIQADLKTFSALGLYGTTVITAVTAQDLRGVTAIQPVEPQVVEKQLLAVLEGFPIKAIKTGMLFSAGIIKVIAGVLKELPALPLVIDPVLAATAGKVLLKKEAVEILKTGLFPLAVLITPNIAEATILGDINRSFLFHST